MADVFAGIDRARAQQLQRERFEAGEEQLVFTNVLARNREERAVENQEIAAADRERRIAREEVTAGQTLEDRASTAADRLRNQGREDVVDERAAVNQGIKILDRVRDDAREDEVQGQEDADRKLKLTRDAEILEQEGVIKALAIVAQAEDAGATLDAGFWEQYPEQAAALGIDPDNTEEISEILQGNPGMAAQLHAAAVGAPKKGAAAVKNIGPVYEVDILDEAGKVIGQRAFQNRTQGPAIEVKLPGSLTINRIRDERIAQAEERNRLRTPEVRGDIKRLEAIGEARGKLAVEDFPSSATDIAKQKSQIRMQIASTDRALNALSKGREQIGFWSSGFVGGVTQFIPGTPAYNAVKRLLPALSQAFAQNLQQMRDLSKTGGAVGNVSDAEGEKMTSMDASLDIGQDKDQLLEQIAIMEEAILTSRTNIEAAFAEDQAARDLVKEADAEGSDTDALLQKYGVN